MQCRALSLLRRSLAGDDVSLKIIETTLAGICSAFHSEQQQRTKQTNKVTNKHRKFHGLQKEIQKKTGKKDPQLLSWRTYFAAHVFRFFHFFLIKDEK